MGQWLSLPMILGGLYLMLTAKRRRVRVEPTAGTASASRDPARAGASRTRMHSRRADHASKPTWKPATLIITRPATRSARRGDFTTAPEISQMLAKMVGAALADGWTRAGAPADAVYAELGPGRGTLASDALRCCGGLDFLASAPGRDKPGAPCSAGKAVAGSYVP